MMPVAEGMLPGEQILDKCNQILIETAKLIEKEAAAFGNEREQIRFLVGAPVVIALKMILKGMNTAKQLDKEANSDFLPDTLRIIKIHFAEILEEFKDDLLP